MTKQLTDKQALKYSRHILLPQMDFEGQERLLNAKVLVMGLGGLGNACVPYLASSGIGKLTLVDFDTIDMTNLQRQVMYDAAQIGQRKAEAAAHFVARQNKDVEVATVTALLDEQSLSALIAQHCVVIDCTDNLETRQLINKCCYAHKVPLVSGAAIRFEGQLTTFNYAAGSPCYQCLSHTFAEQSLSCVEAGVIAPLVGIIGTMQALEAIKLITKIGEPKVGRLYLYDGVSGESREFNYAAHSQCKVCKG